MDLKKNKAEGCGLSSCGSEWCAVKGSCEHDYEHSNSLKWRQFFKLAYQLILDF